jgi:hypothetical protein
MLPFTIPQKLLEIYCKSADILTPLQRGLRGAERARYRGGDALGEMARSDTFVTWEPRVATIRLFEERLKDQRLSCRFQSVHDESRRAWRAVLSEVSLQPTFVKVMGKFYIAYQSGQLG